MAILENCRRLRYLINLSLPRRGFIGRALRKLGGGQAAGGKGYLKIAAGAQSFHAAFNSVYLIAYKQTKGYLKTFQTAFR